MRRARVCSSAVSSPWNRVPSWRSWARHVPRRPSRWSWSGRNRPHRDVCRGQLGGPSARGVRSTKSARRGCFPLLVRSLASGHWQDNGLTPSMTCHPEARVSQGDQSCRCFLEAAGPDQRLHLGLGGRGDRIDQRRAGQRHGKGHDDVYPCPPAAGPRCRACALSGRVSPAFASPAPCACVV